MLLDGDRVAGVLTAAVAMERCIAKARATGFACAGVRNSGHFFAAGSYAALAAEAGMIGFAASNTTPVMAPTGGVTPLLGTQPGRLRAAGGVVAERGPAGGAATWPPARPRPRRCAPPRRPARSYLPG